MNSRSRPPLRHRVKATGEGKAVLDYLVGLLPARSREELKLAFAAGLFGHEDGRPLNANDCLSAGDTILAHLPPKDLDKGFLPLPPNELEVIFEDNDLIAVVKPPGLLSYPQGTQVHGALSIVQEQLKRASRPANLRPLHRIDRETSGVLLMAKTHEADRAVKKAFKQRQVQKSYLCIARGRFPEGMQRCRFPIGPEDKAIRIKMAVRPDGAAAETMFRTIAWFGTTDSPGHTWIEARPRTGRTHQIRVHLAELGHPIVGDKVYCDEGRAFLRRWEGKLDQEDIDRLELPRQALHAWTLCMKHPLTGSLLRLEAKVPEDLLHFATLRGGVGPGPASFLEIR